MIGIHLGANYTRVAITKDGYTTMVREIDIPRDGNADRLASVVSFRSGKIRFGTEALKTQEREIIFDACREAPNYKSDEHVWHANRNSEGQYKVRGLSKAISQEEVISEILSHIRDIVVSRYGSIQKVVLSYPTECTHTYQTMLKNAAHKADFNNFKLTEERVAAAKSFYELSPPSQNPHYLMVFKFGAGSFGISVFEKKNDDNDFNQLESTSDSNMGGEDITNLLIWHCQENFNEKLKENEIRNKELRESCERVKSDLSYFAETKIFLDGEPLCDINRDGLEIICKEIIENIKHHLKIIVNKIQELRIKINDVLLVGGSTRLHFIRNLIDIALKNIENTEYHYDTVVNPEEAIAMGCAIYAASLSITEEDSLKEDSIKEIDPKNSPKSVKEDGNATDQNIGQATNTNISISESVESQSAQAGENSQHDACGIDEKNKSGSLSEKKFPDEPVENLKAAQSISDDITTHPQGASNSLPTTNTTSKEHFPNIFTKEALYIQSKHWLKLINEFKHILEEEKANFKWSYGKESINKLPESSGDEAVGMNFLTVAEISFQRLKFKNDILEQFDQIEDKLGYIKGNQIYKNCIEKLNEKREEVTRSTDITIDDTNKILELMKSCDACINDLHKLLGTQKAELENHVRYIKPKVSKWQEDELVKVLIKPQLYQRIYTNQ